MWWFTNAGLASFAWLALWTIAILFARFKYGDCTLSKVKLTGQFTVGYRDWTVYNEKCKGDFSLFYPAVTNPAKKDETGIFGVHFLPYRWDQVLGADKAFKVYPGGERAKKFSLKDTMTPILGVKVPVWRNRKRQTS